MDFILKYWPKYRKLFVASVSCVAGEALCDLMQPQLLAKAVDEGVKKSDFNTVLRIGALMVLMTALGAVFACLRNVFSSKASQNFGADMRRDLFIKIQKLSVSDAEQYDGGSLVTRLTNDVTQLTNFINGIMRIFVKAPVVCIGGIILASRLNIRLLPIIAGVVFVSFLSIGLSMKLSYPVFAKVQTAIDRMNTTVREYLIGIRLVKAFGRFRHEEQRFEQANELLSRTTIKASRIMSMFSPVSNLAGNAGIVLVLFVGVSLVPKGEMEIGQIMAFVTYMTQILVSMTMISNMLNVFVRTKASYSRIAELMNMPDSEDYEAPAREGGAYNAESILELNGVWFEYPLATGDIALAGISFSIGRGQTLGVIGPTGSGKSSLAALLLKFYGISGGKIIFAGEDISNITPFELRKRVSIVPQAPMLFTGTIRENILAGNRDLSEEEMCECARIAMADEFVTASKDGYDTMLGQGGINLSGGQKQRLSIARALASKPELLILDDCTSALDALTEAKVLDRLRSGISHMSCILISQRISTVMRTDKILVLANGRQAGFGSHEELMTSCEEYRGIYDSQIGGSTEDGNAFKAGSEAVLNG